MGCSHGAGTVSNWAIREDDYPARSFAISSGSFSGHCFYHNGMCLEGQRYADDVLANMPWPHDDADPITYELHTGAELVLGIDSALATSRDFGASWGVDTSPATPVCNADGSYGCFEEGLGFTYGGRRARDAWHAAEGATPTGFFVENAAADCRHCGLDDAAVSCVQCFLLVGRAGMEARCPECLTADEGGPAAECNITCTDGEGCVIGGGVDGGVPDAGGGLDADEIGDAGVPGFDAGPPGGDEGGCSCRLAPGSSGRGIGSLLLAFGLLRFTRRRRP